MIDLVKVLLTAGDGGNGRVAFRREKYVPKGGPSGGQGGDGGDVILRATKDKNTLYHLAGIKQIEAGDGTPGGKKQMTGPAGEDVVVEVPLGTVVWQLGENDVAKQRRQRGKGLADTTRKPQVRLEKYYLEAEGQAPPPRDRDLLDTTTFDACNPKEFSRQDLEKRELAVLSGDGQELRICQGGFGGRGNVSFKGPENVTPLEAEFGSFGERRAVVLELKLLADVGLVGNPSVGKSTFLATVTKAQPKIAAYHFTTLTPQLGVWQLNSEVQVVLADIPGLIEGASQGKGLGYSFLRHIEACRALVVMVSLDPALLHADGPSDQSKAEQLWLQYQGVLQELSDYQPKLTQKPQVVVLTKAELYPKAVLKACTTHFKTNGIDLQSVSSATGRGVKELGGLVYKSLS